MIIAPVGPEYPIAALGARLDLSRCRRLDRTLRDWGLYEEDGTRTFVFRSKTKNWREFSPAIDDVDSVGASYAHIAPLPSELQTAFAKALRSQGGKLISVDIDDHELVALTDRDRPQWREFLGGIDLFLPSRQDVETLFPRVAIPDALRRLRELAPDLKVLAIKLGPDGVIVHAAGRVGLSRAAEHRGGRRRCDGSGRRILRRRARRLRANRLRARGGAFRFGFGLVRRGRHRAWSARQRRRRGSGVKTAEAQGANRGACSMI